jgi:hypothetical protein
VNGDFDVSENLFQPDPAILGSLSPGTLNCPKQMPRSISVSYTNTGPLTGARAEWESIFSKLKDVESRPGLIDELWTKLTIVDKIISLFDEDEWRSSNLHWLKLQQDVWWVKTANGWFDKAFSITTEDYLNTGLGCLILELWYRFVWARYTIAVHAKLVEEQNAASTASQQGSSASEKRGDDEEDILENSDLGEGLDSESEAESSVDEDNDGEIPLTFRAPRPALATNYQASTTSAMQIVTSTPSPARRKSPFKRGADASEPIQMASSASSSSLLNGRSDDAVSLVAHAGSFTSMSPVQKAATEARFDSDDSMENDSLMVCAPGVDEYDDLDVSSAARQDDQMEDDSSENDENRKPSVFEALSDVAQRTQAPIVAEEEYELHSASEIPPAVSLFFPHPAARQAIDTIESAVFAKEAEWDITRALDVFVDLVDHRNNESKLQQRSMPSSSTQLSSNLGTRKQIRAKIDHLYQTKFVPFLKDVGIKVGGDSGRIWKLQPGVESFYDVALVATFGNLSQYGQAPSHNFLQLFPRLAMSSDSRSQIYITQVCYQIHSALQQKGKITPEIDGLISLLDQLIDEKNAILKQIGSVSDAMDDQAVDSDDEEEEKKRTPLFGAQHQALMEKVVATRQNRLREIDQMIESIKDEFNKQTGNIDKLPAKKQKQLATFEQKLNSATASMTTSSAAENDDSMDDGDEESPVPTSEVINSLLTDVLGRQKIGEKPEQL